MSLLSWPFSVEGVLRVCEITAIVAGALAVAALIGKDLAGRAVADRKGKEMQVLQKDVAEARTKQADAERRLLEVQHRLAWRIFDEYKFRNVLEHGAKGKAEIVYPRDDDEAFSFANAIWEALVTSGWDAAQPVPGSNSGSLSFSLREGGMMTLGQPNLSVLVADRLASKPYAHDTPADALMKAFQVAGFTPLHSIPHETIRPPVGTIRIVVGSRL